jgi:hypothetical protein
MALGNAVSARAIGDIPRSVEYGYSSERSQNCTSIQLGIVSVAHMVHVVTDGQDSKRLNEMRVKGKRGKTLKLLAQWGIRNVGWPGEQ